MWAVRSGPSRVERFRSGCPPAGVQQLRHDEAGSGLLYLIPPGERQAAGIGRHALALRPRSVCGRTTSPPVPADEVVMYAMRIPGPPPRVLRRSEAGARTWSTVAGPRATWADRRRRTCTSWAAARTHHRSGWEQHPPHRRRPRHGLLRRFRRVAVWVSPIPFWARTCFPWWPRPSIRPPRRAARAHPRAPGQVKVPRHWSFVDASPERHRKFGQGSSAPAGSRAPRQRHR